MARFHFLQQTALHHVVRGGIACALLLGTWGVLRGGEDAALFAEITRDLAFAPFAEASTSSNALYAAINEEGDRHAAVLEKYTGLYQAATGNGDCDGMVVSAALVNRARTKLGQREPFRTPIATTTCAELCAPYFYYPALIEFDAGRYLESVALLKKALPLATTTEERVNILMTIGACASGLGEVAESVKFAQWAYEQSPKPVSWKLVTNISSNLMGLGQPMEAAALLREHLASTAERHPAVLLNKMQAHAQAGETDSVPAMWAQVEPLLGELPWNPMVLRTLGSVAVLMPTDSFWVGIQERAWASAEETDLTQMFDSDDIRGLLFPQIPHSLASLISNESQRWDLAHKLHHQIEKEVGEAQRTNQHALSTEEARKLLARVEGTEETSNFPAWPVALAFACLAGLALWHRRGTPSIEPTANSEEPATAPRMHPKLQALLIRLEQNIRHSYQKPAHQDQLLLNLKEKAPMLNEGVIPNAVEANVDGTELDILVLTLLGIHAKEIAQICSVSVGHIYNVRTNLRKKFGADSMNLSHWL